MSEIDYVHDRIGTVATPGDVIILGRRDGNYSMTKIGRIKYFKPASRPNRMANASMRVEWFSEICTGYGDHPDSSIQVHTDNKNDFYVLKDLAEMVGSKYGFGDSNVR